MRGIRNCGRREKDRDTILSATMVGIFNIVALQISEKKWSAAVYNESDKILMVTSSTSVNCALVKNK